MEAKILVIGALGTVGAETVLALLRLRFKLIIRGRKEKMLLVEESAAIAFEGAEDTPCATGSAAWSLLEASSSGNLADVARERMVEKARSRITALLDGPIAAYAKERAATLAEDHGRVRAAGVNVPRVTVESVLPADIMGVFAMIPGSV